MKYKNRNNVRVCSLNTEKSTVWALRVFHEWKGKGDVCLDDLLDNPDVLLNSWILRFIGKLHINKKVEPYPSETIHQILAVYWTVIQVLSSSLINLRLLLNPFMEHATQYTGTSILKALALRHLLSHLRRRTFCGNLR